MAEITLKDNDKPEDTIDTKLELLKYTSEVQSRIKADINSDFILAKLNDADKEGIIEMTGNAYAIKHMISMYRKKGTKWTFKNKKWQLNTLNKIEKQQLKESEDYEFDKIMIRCIMTSITSRNVDKNYLLKYISGIKDDENENDNEMKTAIDTLKNKLSNEDKNKSQ